MTRQGGLAACWAAVGMLLCAPLVVPYATTGPLSRGSGLTNLRILRDTGLAGSFPFGSTYVLVVMPMVGLSLLATAAWQVPSGLRALALAVSMASLILIVGGLGISDPHNWGVAVWLGTAGLVAGVVALAISAVPVRLSERTPR